MSTYQDLFDNFYNQVIDKIDEDQSIRSLGSNEDFKQEVAKYIFERNKKLSQLVAKTWLPNVYPEGAEFRAILLSKKESGEKTKEIKEFLKKHDIDIDGILGSAIGGPIDIQVSWDTFGGTIGEIQGRGPYMLPYPPRPSEVTDEQLESWINDNNPNNPFPHDPYIPLTGL
jgi:hypothetical protein